MGVKAILFDIDDTLFPSSEFAEKARRNAIAAMVEEGLERSADEAYAALESIIRKYGSNYPRHFDALLDRLGVKENRARLIAAGVAAYHNTKGTIAPFPDVPKTLVRLRDLGYRLYAVSEGKAVKQWDKLIRLGLDFFFHGAFISEELGCGKSVRFYRAVTRKLVLKPGELLMVGDRLDKDVVPAKKAGMRAVRVLQGKYASQAAGKTRPDFEITRVGELLGVLKQLG
ncbi:MAG: TIGR02253 family HAD-type hydrolase [Candidatus Micrarchaeia archaeon]